MEKQLISFDVAKAEVEKWIDNKRLSEKKKESLSSMAENLIEGVQNGVLTFDEDHKIITHNLVWPEGVGADQLVYKFRITEKDKEPHKRIVKGDTFADEMTRTIMAMTGCPVNVARNLDSSTDRSYAESIATFFLP